MVTRAHRDAVDDPDALARPRPPVVLVPIPAESPPQPGRFMLNYIWAGLIVASFVFALGYDVRDLSSDRYRNGQPLPVALRSEERRVGKECRSRWSRYP